MSDAAYTGFAGLYDEFMDNVPYEDWSRDLALLLGELGIRDGLVLELGCGTGTITEAMSEAGFDMIGIDVSEEMLSEAMEKRDESGSSILYLLQDMREFELYGTVRAVFCLCDGMNYLTENGDLETVFSLVNNYLDPEGYFIFDLNTRYKYETVIGDRTIAETRDDAAFIWENSFDPEQSLNYYSLTLFAELEDGTYERMEETHVQRAYSLKEVRDAAEKAGLIFEGIYAGLDRKPLAGNEERVYIILKEHGKMKG